MANLGQDATSTGRLRGKVLRDAVTDNLPVLSAMKEQGGIHRKSYGRDIVEEAKMAQNSSVAFVPKSGAVSLADTDIMDAATFDWKYLMGSVTWTVAEQLMNRGEGEYVDLIGSKYEVLEDSLMNLLHTALLGDGTTANYIVGLAALVSTTPASGTVGGLDRSVAANAWFKNQSATSTTACGSATVDAANVKRFLSYGIDKTTRNSKTQGQIGLLGETHWGFATQAIEALQVIQNKSDVGGAGFDKLRYRGIDLYNGGGVSFSGLTQATATRSYILNVKRGGFNLCYMKGAEFDLLEPVNSADQAAVSRLMFTMLASTIGGLAKLNWVGYDG